MSLRKIYCSVILCMCFLFLIGSAQNMPQSRLNYRSVGLNCYNCRVCMQPLRRQKGTWYPTFYYWENMWIAGNEKKGMLYFYERPEYDEDELGPLLYMYESRGEPDPPEKAMYVPAGEYLVLIDAENPENCFKGYNGTCRDDMFFYEDDGTGPHTMTVEVWTDKEKYGAEDSTALVYVQATDSKTQEYLQVDTLWQTITLPDFTVKTLVIDDFSWNDENKVYEYCWDFTNDQKEYSQPKEGLYDVHTYVKKSFYQDVQAKTGFGVCYHVGIDLEFDKDILEYSLGEPVKMTVHLKDENGEPLSVEVKSVLMLPDGSLITDIKWSMVDNGVYTARYFPEQEGQYCITVGAKNQGKCYLEEASATFQVRNCEDASVVLEIGDTVLDEPIQFVLTVADDKGNPLPGGRIESLLCIPEDPPFETALSWKDNRDGTYIAEFMPSIPGHYYLSGTINVFGEIECFAGSFESAFTVTDELPDLVIWNNDVTVKPNPAEIGMVTISVVVRNIGDRDAGPFYVLVLINGEKLESRFVEGLAAGDSIKLEFNWFVEYTGKYTITAVADAGEEIE